MHTGKLLCAAAALAALAAAVQAGTPAPNETINIVGSTNAPPAPVPFVPGAEINLSGATLFADFYPTEPSTRDYINVNKNYVECGGVSDLTRPRAKWYDSDCPADGLFDQSEQLAGGFAPGIPLNSFWLVQVRSVGSGNGLGEFINFQLCGTIPKNAPSEGGWFNRYKYCNVGGVGIYPGPYVPGNNSYTPYEQSTIDIAVMDVPLSWFVTEPGTPNWDATPAVAGYGLNPLKSFKTEIDPGGESNQLKNRCKDCNGDTVIDPATECLNLNYASPDANTVYDNLTAHVPVAVIAHVGTGRQTVKYTELRHLFATGRMPNGENLLVCTRDAGSGTRNAAMNSICLDPSYGRGDNSNKKIAEAAVNDVKVGPGSKWVNCGGSGLMEDAVQNHGLAIGYSGVAGSSRAAKDANDGKYEILGVIYDEDLAGNPVCTTEVRPTKSAIIYNADPCTGYQISGPQTFATRGHPDANRDPADPRYDGTKPALTNQGAADYINNIQDSVAEFESIPLPPPPEENFMPGWLLARTYFLPAGIEALPVSSPAWLPCTYAAQGAAWNTNLASYMATNNDLGWTVAGVKGDTYPFGQGLNSSGVLVDRPAHRVPARVALPYGSYPQTQYDDGSTTGAYKYYVNTTPYTISSGYLADRNKVMGDFLYDGLRNLNDIPEMMLAYADRLTLNTWQVVPVPGNARSQAGNVPIMHVIGDFDGNGNFDVKDVRYFADGLAIDPLTGKLDRKQGFTLVDASWSGGNFFGTTLACGTYANGDSRGDVTGSAGGPARGALPQGADGAVNLADVEYVKANMGDWADLDDAAVIDLSADMDGDLDVDCDDVKEIVENILDTNLGDLDLDGDVDATDLATITANIGIASGATYAQGDLDCDGDVDADDLAIAQPPAASVTGRHVFYNQSYYDGNNAAIDAAPIAGAINDDDDAIDTSKTALLPGAGTATTANYVGYVKGVNGLMIDVQNATRPPVAGDFTFIDKGRTGTASVAKAPSASLIRPLPGGDGNDYRCVFTFTWPTDQSKKAVWLECRVGTGFGLADLGGSYAGLGDIFWYGQAFAEGQSLSGTNALVNATDTQGAKNNGHGALNRAKVWDEYDYNKDSLVNATDQQQPKTYGTSSLNCLVLISR